jgi:hypothetical protein
MISQLMTGNAHEVLGVKGWMGRVKVFPSTCPNDLRVTLCDPSGARDVFGREEKLRHG